MKKLFALSACALALAACSNNGGTYYGPKPQMQGQNTQQGGQQGQGGAQGQGNTQTPPPAAAVNKGDKYLTTGKSTLAFPDDANIHKLTVDGKEFDLSGFKVNANAQGLQQSGWGVSQGRAPAGLSDAAVLNGSENMTVGVVRLEGSNDRHAFFNGKFTKEDALPSNKVSYEAKVFTTTPKGMGAGGAELTADFATKKLNATGGLTFDADIKGNRFETAAGSETTAKGGFFGDKAMEIGGAFQKGEELGVFHGKQKEEPKPAGGGQP